MRLLRVLEIDSSEIFYGKLLEGGAVDVGDEVTVDRREYVADVLLPN